MVRITFIFLLLLSALPAWAAGEDYTVAGITIDQPTTDATTARDEALGAALAKAYEQLRERRAAAGETLPAAEVGALWKIMQDFEVADERISATRYAGTFTIRFRSTAVAEANAAAVALETANTTSQNAIFTFSHLMEWQSARAALKNTAGVRAASITAFRRNQVDFSLTYAGAADALVSALVAQGFSVTAAPNNPSLWQIAFRGQ